MTYLELKDVCRKGKTGLIPGWKGYVRYNYSLNELQFECENYIMNQKELEDKISNRKDLYYIT